MLDVSLFEVTHALIRMSRMRVSPHAWASATGEYSFIFLRLVDNASIGSIVSGNYLADTFCQQAFTPQSRGAAQLEECGS